VKNIMTKKILILIAALILPPAVFCAPNEAYQSYVLGLLANRSGNSMLARQAYEHVLNLDSGAVSVLKDLALLYLQSGDRQKAFDAARKFLNADPENPQTHLFLGSFYLMAGDSRKAKESWEKTLSLDPDNETATVYLAAYNLSEDPQESVKLWRKFMKNEPEIPEGFYQIGIAQEKSGNYEEAIVSLEKALSIKPDMTEARLALAQIYENRREFDSAVRNYEKAVEYDRENFTLLSYLAGLYYRLKDYSAAEAAYRRAYGLNPKDQGVNFWLGLLAEQRKDWVSAAAYFEYLRKQEENSGVLARLGYYYSMMKEHTKALKCLIRVAELEPDSASSHYLLALAYMDTKKYAKSEKHFLRAIEISPKFEEVYFNMGVMYDQSGNFPKAEPVLKKTIELNPKNAAALNYLGYSYADRNINLDDAEKYILLAIGIEPENPAFIDSLGWLYFRKGEFDKAVEKLSFAAAKINDPVILEHLGDAYLKSGDQAGAWDAYSKAVSLPGRSGSLKNKLRGLEKLVLPSTIQRKVLKRAEGNLLQISSIKASVLISAKSREYNYRSFGHFSYLRPGMWRVDILGNFMAPSLVIIENGGLKFYPRAMAVDPYVYGSLAANQVGNFLNASVLKQFDSPDVKTERRGSIFYYKLAGKELEIDSHTGTVSRFVSGNELSVQFSGHALVEGLYIPSKVNIRIFKLGLEALIELKDASVNTRIDKSVFALED